MRTTLALEDDAIKDIRAYARNHRLSLGKAASELIRRGARYQLSTSTKNSLPVLDASDDFPLLTSKQVRAFLEDE